jgi:Flp pilus assembly pilin Flp
MAHSLGRWGRAAEESGTALVELALVLPLVMVLMLGMVDFGKAFNSWIDETHLANEAARLAAVNYVPAGGWSADGCTDANPNVCLARYIQRQADTGELKTGRSGDEFSPTQNAARICISYPVGAATTLGDPVQVTVEVRYHWLRYLTRQISLLATPIVGKATMRLEALPPSGAVVTSAIPSANCYPASPAGT